MLGERFNAGAPRDVVVVVPQKDHEGTHRGRGRKRDTIRKKVNDTWKQRMRERERERDRNRKRKRERCKRHQGPPNASSEAKSDDSCMILIVFFQNDARAHKISKNPGFLVFFFFFLLEPRVYHKWAARVSLKARERCQP